MLTMDKVGWNTQLYAYFTGWWNHQEKPAGEMPMLDQEHMLRGGEGNTRVECHYWSPQQVSEYNSTFSLWAGTHTHTAAPGWEDRYSKPGPGAPILLLNTCVRIIIVIAIICLMVTMPMAPC